MDIINLNTNVDTKKMAVLLTNFFSEEVRILTNKQADVTAHLSLDRLDLRNADFLDSIANRTAQDLMISYNYGAIENTVVVVLNEYMPFNMLLLQCLARHKTQHKTELNAWIVLHNASNDELLEIPLV